VCQLPAEASCFNDSGCPLPLVCGIDQNCRGTCTSAAQCPTGQKCANQNVCADPAQVDVNNDLLVKRDGGGIGTGGAVGHLDGGAGGAIDSGSKDGATDAPLGGGGGDAAADGAGGATAGSCVGKIPSKFGRVATSDSNPKYTSGVGVRTASEFVVFNGYAGPSSSAIDGGTATVNRIDLQHFDVTTGTSKGQAVALMVASGDGSGLYINGAAVAPTGEIALIYSAATNTPNVGIQWGVYLQFLDKDLAPIRTTQFVALGLNPYADQSSVKWLNGNFVASSVVGSTSAARIRYVSFGIDGSIAGSSSAIPTDDPSGLVHTWNYGQGEVAFSGGLFAAAFVSNHDALPYLTIIDTLGVEVGSPIKLPAALNGGNLAFVSVAGTSEGFVTIYNGVSSSNTNSLLATFLSSSPAVDGGVGTVASTHAFSGGLPSTYPAPWTGRASSDGVGAGFAVLYPDGSVTFLYLGSDGSVRTSPQTVLQQMNAASNADEPHILSYGGSFAVSLYSSGEHLTRMVASSCQ
jgi:hypothetical protein